MKFLFYSVWLLIFFSASLAQSQSQGQLNDLMKRGKELVQNEEYEQANMTFKRILTLNQSIPSEFCYYFAKSLFHTAQYHNSKNFINKYYELSGQGGEFSAEIKQLETLIDDELSRIGNCDLCDDNGHRLETCDHCDASGTVMKVCPTCKGKGNMICDLCGGGGVLIRRNVFNANEYQTCSKCEGSGIIKCVRCEGAKEISVVCPECKGMGDTPSGGMCNHLPDPH
jgi:hypothetical protein